MSQSDGVRFLGGFWLFPLFSCSVIVPGSRLLSADADGHIKCWSMTDHLANSWENTVGSVVEGDPVVALSWLHNGVKLALHVEKVCPGSTGDLGWSAGSGLCKGLRMLPVFRALGSLVALGKSMRGVFPVKEKSDSWFLLNSERGWTLVSLGVLNVSPLVWYLSSRLEHGDRAILSLPVVIQRKYLWGAEV